MKPSPGPVTVNTGKKTKQKQFLPVVLLRGRHIEMSQMFSAELFCLEAFGLKRRPTRKCQILAFYCWASRGRDGCKIAQNDYEKRALNSDLQVLLCVSVQLKKSDLQF